MNQVEHPATGWRDPLICTRRSTSPAPCLARRSPARLTPGRQRRNKGAGGGTRQRLPPETEGGSGWRQSSFAGRHGCEECSRSPYCLGSFVLLHTHPAPQPHRRKYWERDRNGFVEGRPRAQKGLLPSPRRTCPSGPPARAPSAPEGREGPRRATADGLARPGGCRATGQTDTGQGGCFSADKGHPAAPSGSPRGRAALAPRVAGPASPAELRWGPDLAARATDASAKPPLLCQAAAVAPTHTPGEPHLRLQHYSPPKSCRAGGRTPDPLVLGQSRNCQALPRGRSPAAALCSALLPPPLHRH